MTTGLPINSHREQYAPNIRSILFFLAMTSSSSRCSHSLENAFQFAFPFCALVYKYIGNNSKSLNGNKWLFRIPVIANRFESNSSNCNSSEHLVRLDLPSFSIGKLMVSIVFTKDAFVHSFSSESRRLPAANTLSSPTKHYKAFGKWSKSGISRSLPSWPREWKESQENQDAKSPNREIASLVNSSPRPNWPERQTNARDRNPGIIFPALLRAVLFISPLQSDSLFAHQFLWILQYKFCGWIGSESTLWNWFESKWRIERGELDDGAVKVVSTDRALPGAPAGRTVPGIEDADLHPLLLTRSAASRTASSRAPHSMRAYPLLQSGYHAKLSRELLRFLLCFLSLSLFLLENKGKNWSESIYLARSKNIDDNAVWSLPWLALSSYSLSSFRRKDYSSLKGSPAWARSEP